MIVFGGQDALGYQFDVYVLSLGASPTWSKPSVTGPAPSGRMGHTAIYDAANQQMVVFGGFDGSGEMSDVQFMSLPSSPPFSWLPTPVNSGPVKRTEHAALYDGLRQQMVIFGGLDDLTLPDGSLLNDETWLLALGPFSATWTQLSFTGTPSFRQGHTIVYDAPNQRLVLFGGDTTTIPTPSNELWGLQLNAPVTWTFLSPWSGSPPSARFGHTAIYDGGFQRMIIFGGYDSSGFPNFSDTSISDF